VAKASPAPKADDAKPVQSAGIKPPPVVCVSKDKMMSLIAKGPLPPVPSNIKGSVAAFASIGAKGDVTDAYKKVAPATVIVTTEQGMGSGVIVDPAGWVLTNYHVVDGGKTEDFKIKVSVEIGQMKDGRMERTGKLYDAYVHKADPVRDLAVVKIVNPPPNLPAIKVAKKDIEIASPVLTVAHASIGFLWAAKGCQVSAVGEKSKDLASLVMLDCKKKEGEDPEESEKAATQCQERNQRIHDLINSQQQGLVIQSDCSITHGDSGGPLVNTAGELVGLNQSIKFDKTTTSFHVHGSEIREFLAKIPAKPAQLPPDPWCDGGIDSTLEDIDLDGHIDTLYVKGFNELGMTDRMAFLLDLDQDQFSKQAAATPAQAAQGEESAFDAEAIVLLRADGAFIWYDSDNNGQLDLLLVDEQGSGSPATAWRIAADKSMAKDESAAGAFDLRPEVFKDEKIRARFARIAQIIRPYGWTSYGSLGGASEPQIPDGIWGGGRKGELRDGDGDGRPDTMRTSSTFSDGYVVDADEDTLGSLQTTANPQELINERKVDVELSIVRQGQNLWAMYDTNNDGKLDLALLSPPSDVWGLALAAWRIDGAKPTPAPEFIGRKLIRPALAGSSAQQLYKVATRLPYATAPDDGAGSLPSPYMAGRYYEMRDVKGFSKAVIESAEPSTTVCLVDIDQSSTRSIKPGADLNFMVRSGGMKADMAHLHHRGMEWAYYDTDQDGKFDLFLFSASPKNGRSERAFRLNANNQLELDAAAGSGPLIRWSVFAKKPVGAEFKKLAKEVFDERAIEP
jgi:hypothetical protein